jgi:hypothetical protein
VCTRLQTYEPALAQLAEAYAALLAKAPISDKAALETDVALVRRAVGTAAAAAAEAAKRASEPMTPMAAHLLVKVNNDELSPQSRSHRKRRVSVRRKTVSDVISMLATPLQLPEFPNRIVQVSGSLAGTIRQEANPSQQVLSSVTELRHNLMSDVWIVHTATRPY